MRRLEDIINKMTDTDAGWWPILRLRPPRQVEMDDVFIVRLSMAAGCVLGVLLVYPVSCLYDVPADLFTALVITVFGAVAYFIPAKFLMAHFWNRRARRLQLEAHDDRSRPLPPS